MLADDYLCFIEDVTRDGVQFGGGAELSGFDNEPSDYVQKWSRGDHNTGPKDSDARVCWKLFHLAADVQASPLFDISIANELQLVAGGHEGRDVLILSGDRKGRGVVTV